MLLIAGSFYGIERMANSCIIQIFGIYRKDLPIVHSSHKRFWFWSLKFDLRIYFYFTHSCNSFFLPVTAFPFHKIEIYRLSKEICTEKYWQFSQKHAVLYTS